METSGIKISGPSLSSNLYYQLRKDILQGKMVPGEKITEQEICDLYSISRTPVREAFRQLEIEGLIETVLNRGTFVIGLSLRDIKDLYEMRKAFEIIAVRWAIKRITEEEMESLEEAYDFMEFYTYKKDADKMLNINMDFHELIYQAAHNRMLAHTLSVYQYFIMETKANSAYLDGHLEEVLHEHKEIFTAFVNGDPDAAEKAVAIHLDNAKVRAGF